MPQIDQRLAARGASNSLLERQRDCAPCCAKASSGSKTHGGVSFTDEWRYYNVLYFPYVIGLKPYSRKFDADDLDALTRQALDWFLTTVPERTLYNWQTAGTKLTAQDLQEQLRRGYSSGS